MSDTTTEKQFALAYLESIRQRMSDFDMEIWRYAEPAWREYKSARAYRDLLAGEGFAVEEGSGGMPTAFAATWGDGAPVLGSFSEYDATPGHSQQATPYRAPRVGFTPGRRSPLFDSMLGTLVSPAFSRQWWHAEVRHSGKLNSSANRRKMSREAVPRKGIRD